MKNVVEQFTDDDKIADAVPARELEVGHETLLIRVFRQRLVSIWRI